MMARKKLTKSEFNKLVIDQRIRGLRHELERIFRDPNVDNETMIYAKRKILALEKMEKVM